MLILGYIAAMLIGISLGLIGGGGSILTVPVLVYIFHLEPANATTYSLFIVGFTSLIGAMGYLKRKQINIPVALLYASSSILTVLATRRLLLPLIPEHIFSLGEVNITKSMLTMILFAFLMVLASVSMIRNGSAAEQAGNGAKMAYSRIIGYGVVIGFITGLLGAGGGFLIIPALIMLMKMPMKEAVGTSLLIIALNSLLGFAGDIAFVHIEWTFLLGISMVAAIGILLGARMSKRIEGARLKKGFGWFVLMMGIYIFAAELL
ncbi:MAG: sulfite exporter TauE/SafE family protein [Chitinophaga sp.]|uniref:sulfite exporter TauE/SafE family protein n=1 Tax=Chitinophaga sp. TaxID=1869181 RepID=UPI0025BCF985|nr:sulfite exporter TauE/SafE family protein [Chitinophaga sp.]MBV8251564.1 sulfite exporter TauE/SafE family protein [Chitinophaga sp.]